MDIRKYKVTTPFDGYKIDDVFDCIVIATGCAYYLVYHPKRIDEDDDDEQMSTIEICDWNDGFLVSKSNDSYIDFEDCPNILSEYANVRKIAGRLYDGKLKRLS